MALLHKERLANTPHMKATASMCSDLRLQTASNIAQVLALRTVFEVVELLLSFRLGLVGSVGVADRTE